MSFGVFVFIEEQRVAKALGPHYDVGRLLGAGAFGTVYEVNDLKLERMIAVKAIEICDKKVGEVLNAKEARILAKLDHHPHIVKIHDYREAGGFCLILMENLRGGSLADRFQRGAQLPKTMCAIALAMADALYHVHELGVLHLDVTPQNILFTDSSLPKLTDMNLAKILTDTSAGAWHGGTPNYSAPERHRGANELSAATDVYSIATCLYRGLAGRLPFAAQPGRG